MAAIRKTKRQSGYGEKLTVTVVTVDKEKRRVECATRDGAMIYVAVWETGTVFRWPKQGEVWTVRQDIGIWRLDQMVQSELAESESDSTPVTLEDLPEAETRIQGTKVHMNDVSLGALSIEGHSISSAKSIPTEGTWSRGDIVYNALPSSGGYIGWVCTASGTPGTWKTFGPIS